MSYRYDPDNVFAKVLRHELPAKVVLDSEHSLAFEDIRPQAPCHVLVIPKGPYVNFDHFSAEASMVERADLFDMLAKVVAFRRLAPGASGNGYRIVTNAGEDGVQEVPHLHFHVVGGRCLGPLLPQV